MSIGCAHTVHSRAHHFGWNPANEPTLRVAPGDSVEFNIVDKGGGEITPKTTVAGGVRSHPLGDRPLAPSWA